MDHTTFREAARAMIDDIVAYNETIDSRPAVSGVEPGYLRRLLPPTAPESAEPWTSLRADMDAAILPGITHWQSPRFMAFFPCANSYPAMLADMWSNALSGAHFNWICSPAVTELETIVLDWLARAFALPSTFLSDGPTRGGGVIHGTASEAILTMMVAAREKYLAEASARIATEAARKEDTKARRPRLAVLGSSSTHSSTEKAARMLGVEFVSIPVGPETGWSLTGEAFAAAVRECREKRGLEPFYTTITYGTTNTCATDDLAGITAANVSGAGSGTGSSDYYYYYPEQWLHVDAAYAGAALICPEYQSAELTESLAKVHSFNFNPHKWLLTSFDCSASWVQQRAHLVDALSIQPPFLRNPHSEGGLVTDYRNWQLPLGRRFRSLKLWFVVRSYGLEGLRAHIRKGCTLGKQFEDMLRSRAGLFEIMSPARFGLVVLRITGAGDSLTTSFYEKVNSSGEVYLTSTVLGGRFAVRVCTGVASVEEEHIKRAFNVMVSVAEEVVRKDKP